MSNAITTTTPTLPNSFAKEFSSKSLELLGTLGHATVTQAEVMLPLAKSLIADGIVYTDLFSPDGGAVETCKAGEAKIVATDTSFSDSCGIWDDYSHRISIFIKGKYFAGNCRRKYSSSPGC